MTLTLVQDEPNGRQLTENNPTNASIVSIVRDIDWTIFTFLTLKDNETNWIQISGNLADDGLAIVLERNGSQEVSEYPPGSIDEVENVLVSYITNEYDGYSKYFEAVPQLSQRYYNWKAAKESEPKKGWFSKILPVMVSLAIITLVGWMLYLWFTHEFKFLGHSTSTIAATVVETKYRPYMKSMVQIAKYEFEIDQKAYIGYFRASTVTTRKHFIGDRVKIKYAVDDPSISKRIGTYAKKYKHNMQ